VTPAWGAETGVRSSSKQPKASDGC
jgi:hypothetical protein